MLTILTGDFESYCDRDYSLRNMTPVEYVAHSLFECIGMSVRMDTIKLPMPVMGHNRAWSAKARWVEGPDLPKLFAAIDVYVSDFGELKAVPSRFQRTRDVFLLQSDKWAVAYLRPFTTVELATTGDATQRELVCEYAIEARAPKANAAVYDIT